MRRHISILILIFISNACQPQSKKVKSNQRVGGPCEGCEAVYEYDDKILDVTDTLPTYLKNEPKLKITGTVFQNNGKTPAKDVILYIYHTNRNGIYETIGNEKGWARRHGHIRGWVKTDANGTYTFYTFRPVSYPNLSEPEHIHIIVKEPSKNEYYVDDYVFDDDPLLTTVKRNKLRNKGGSGIAKPSLEGKVYLINRDIILGLNILDYK